MAAGRLGPGTCGCKSAHVSTNQHEWAVCAVMHRAHNKIGSAMGTPGFRLHAVIIVGAHSVSCSVTMFVLHRHYTLHLLKTVKILEL